MKKNKLYILFLVAILSWSCVEEYHPEGLAQSPEILVVDGVITNNETVIKLSKSIGLTSNFGPNDEVGTATMYIETGNGSRSPKAEKPLRGTYVFSNVILQPDSLYRLRIEYNDDVFVSEFLSPMQTPEIDSLSWEKPGSGEPVSIYVNTSGDNDKSRFYRWTYEEIWEFTAPLYANGRYQIDTAYVGDSMVIDTSIILYDEINGPFNMNYYCWQSKRSQEHLVASTAHLSENIVRKKKLHEAPSSSNRFSVLYYFEVKQYLIRESAYYYYENQQKNVESMGSIFAPIPSEMNGNITCLTSDIPVIGYIDVTTNTSKDFFISADNNIYEPPYRSCEVQTVAEYGFLPYLFEAPSGFSYAPTDCIDCVSTGGTKDKPAFWPNNHF